MHLLAMKTVCPTLTECRVSAKTAEEEQQFVRELAPLVPDMELVATGTDGARAMEGADILVTATSAQAPLLKAAWMKPGSFYSHVGGWEDEYAVAKPVPEDRLRRLGDGEAPHPDPEPDVQGRRADRQPTSTGTWTRSWPARSRAGRPTRSASTSTPSGWPSSTSPSPWPCTGGPSSAGKGRELTMQETMIFDHPDMAELRPLVSPGAAGRRAVAYLRGGADRAAAARRAGGGASRPPCR